MLVSTTLLSKATMQAQNSYKASQENYEKKTKATAEPAKEEPKKELPFPVAVVLLGLALIVFVFELVVLFHAVKIALKCSRPGPQRICHLVLAVFFTYPYLLFALFMSDCAQKV
jgi:hypothetical protein